VQKGSRTVFAPNIFPFRRQPTAGKKKASRTGKKSLGFVWEGGGDFASCQGGESFRLKEGKKNLLVGRRKQVVIFPPI